MTKSQERLEFAVRFAQEKVSEMRPGDLLNFRDDFRSFLVARKGEDMRGPIGEIVQPFEAPIPADCTVAYFETLQKEVSAILNNLVAGRDAGTPSFTGCEINVTLSVFSFPAIKNLHVLMAQGLTRDMFLLRLYLLLSQEPINRILRCEASDCDRLFYRKRKQKFCSQRCTNREYQKKYRQDPNFKAAATAEANHKRYERQKGKKAKRRRAKKQ